MPLEVLHDVGLSAGARLVYLDLLFRAWKAETFRDDDPPPLDALAAGLGFGLTATKTYVRELRDRGLVDSIRRGRGLPNSLVIHDVRGSESVSLEGRNPTARKPESDSLTRARDSSPKKEEREATSRKRNPYFDALVDSFGAPSTRSEASLYAKRARELEEAFVGNVPLDAPAALAVHVLEVVRKRVAALRRAWGADKVTVNSIVSNWTHAGNLVAGTTERGPRARGVDPSDPDYGV